MASPFYAETGGSVFALRLKRSTRKVEEGSRAPADRLPVLPEQDEERPLGEALPFHLRFILESNPVNVGQRVLAECLKVFGGVERCPNAPL
ncbi:hypothetical protein [Paraburkholderia fynbosensis]|uniref:hypothetical protein n=1 Tax=Paraburkholderia fynbosensis TaxID=1200993 RepID=UPI0015835068|nr:hypothetical protein [Paraburkholderia fynbosensis]